MFSNEFAETKAVVFWDVDDYKIPDGLDAGEVSKNIKAALADMGHRGKVSIKAYANETNQIQDNVGLRLGFSLFDCWLRDAS